MDKIPRGRPPRSKNVLTKHDSDPQEESESEPEVKQSEPKLEPKSEPQLEVQVKEKKPRSEKQQEAMKKMVEANKAKRQIKIIEKEPQVPRPIQVPESNKHDEYLNMFKQMNDRLNQFQPKKEVKVKEKEVKTPKPKKKIQKESSEEESESESDDEYVERYKQKAEKRFEAVKQIEQRLQQVRPKGRFDHLSLFQ